MGRIYRPNFNRIQKDNSRFNNNNKYKFNWHNIREVRLIDQNGTMVGVVPTQQALQMAKDAELDLINISPNAVPPVCKIYDYGKYNYEKQKKQKDNKSSTKQKEIQFTINIGANDLDIKLKKAVEFLQAKNSVQLVMQLKGRDMPRVNVAMELMQNICDRLRPYSKQVEEPKMAGRKILAMCR